MFNLLQQINHLLYGSLFLFPSRLLLYGFARIKASATIDADTSDELCCGSIPHSLCVWLNPNYAVKVKSLEKLLGDSEFQLSSYIASTKKSYGIRSIHVDGNDALAVFTAVQEARKIAVNEHKTVLVESRVQTKQNAGADKRQQYKVRKLWRQVNDLQRELVAVRATIFREMQRLMRALLLRVGWTIIINDDDDDDNNNNN
ncbi:hypothetical protein T459_01522 [Capsicum annuum]|uniref:Dehydrogenase E1 component domain-containing protein n=1 Tax=Capsicum annuum TaxID=4072 RepID=A0A2G3AHF7_CAPAN|nr:hypothetical protein T459_01522 [Capsicum annuum]